MGVIPYFENILKIYAPFSEDPYLTGICACEITKDVQENYPVMVCPRHIAVNEREISNIHVRILEITLVRFIHGKTECNAPSFWANWI